MSSIYKNQQTSVYGVCEEERSSYEESKCSCFWDYLTPFTRFWGIVTSIVLCGVGVDVTVHHHTLGVYLIIGALIIFILEITWAVTLFLQVCVRDENSLVWRCWDVVLWLNLWKRGLLYLFLSTILFLRPHRLWLSIVAGMQLIVLGVCYLLLTFRKQMQRKNSGRLLLSRSPSQEDRFEDTDLLDESLPGPVSTDTFSELDRDATILQL